MQNLKLGTVESRVPSSETSNLIACHMKTNGSVQGRVQDGFMWTLTG